MDEKQARKQIVDTGIALLQTGLVARTWGNVSARRDGGRFLITPSGLDYNTMEEDDIVLMDISGDEWSGKHRPSGEKGVHKAAYSVYDDVSFVIHTHQTYAAAIGLAGFEELDISEDERQRLGGIAAAGYGLPGSKKLTGTVRGALESGAKTVLMKHHGALICGESMDDAMQKAQLLEEICRRNCRGQQGRQVRTQIIETGRKLAGKLQEEYPYSDMLQTPEAVAVSESGEALTAQLDDMAQMTGYKAPAVQDSRRVAHALKAHGAVIVTGLGIAVRAGSRDDFEALMILMQKAAVVKLHTEALHKKAALGRGESALMNLRYRKKYSKQKDRKGLVK